MLKIGDLQLPSSCFLAPLAGISDLPFRTINRSRGCKFAFTEMVSARSLMYRSATTLKMLSTGPQDRPLGVQLVGNDPEVLKKAVELISPHGFDLIDLNAACPVGKVTGKGEGAALLREPRKLTALLRTIVEHADMPVTVKIRSGWDETSVTAREAALYAEDAGIQGLIIHGRTREQGYSGSVDYETIRKVKEALRIPVIASGDALSPVLIKRLFDETGCDGVAIARGTLGNPWIFRETEEFLATGSAPDRPGIGEIAAAMEEHLDLCCDFHGDRGGATIFRKFFGWYTKGMRNVKLLRTKAFQAASKSEMALLIGELPAAGKETAAKQG